MDVQGKVQYTQGLYYPWVQVSTGGFGTYHPQMGAQGHTITDGPQVVHVYPPDGDYYRTMKNLVSNNI